jgi:hypothetical protein
MLVAGSWIYSGTFWASYRAIILALETKDVSPRFSPPKIRPRATIIIVHIAVKLRRFIDAYTVAGPAKDSL